MREKKKRFFRYMEMVGKRKELRCAHTQIVFIAIRALNLRAEEGEHGLLHIWIRVGYLRHPCYPGTSELAPLAASPFLQRNRGHYSHYRHYIFSQIQTRLACHMFSRVCEYV